MACLLPPRVQGALFLAGTAVAHVGARRWVMKRRYVAAVRGALTSGTQRSGEKCATPIRHPPSKAQDDARLCKRVRFFRELLEEHGVKHDPPFKVVHVAGTKGKGTVCELVRCGLVANGKSVGTFTSPHLHSVRERIRVGDRCIPKADFTRLWGRVQAAFSRITDADSSWPVFFDKMFALALAFFIEQKVEYVVLEVGVGGRYDSTNTLASIPAVAVITSISYDHMDLLGPTLADIAWQKAGIIRPGAAVLTPSSQAPEALETIQSVADGMGASLRVVETSSGVTYGGHDSSIEDHELQLMVERLSDRFHEDNVRLAAAALRRLGLQPRGFEAAYWPGRFETFTEVVPRVDVVMDVAHNADSVAKLLRDVEERFPGRRLHVIFGTGYDKDKQGMMTELARKQSHIACLVLVRARHSKAVDVDSLAGLALQTGFQQELVKETSPQAAMAGALRHPGNGNGGGHAQGDVVVVTGSFYVVAAARAHLAQVRRDMFRKGDWVFDEDPEEAMESDKRSQTDVGKSWLLAYFDVVRKWFK